MEADGGQVGRCDHSKDLLHALGNEDALHFGIEQSADAFPTDGGRQASEGQGSAPAPQEPPATTPPWPVLRPAPTEDEDPLPGDFVPPEPPPLFSGRPTLVLAACALLLPILALLLLAVLPVSPPGWGMLALVLVAVAGGGGLFLQLPRRGDGRGDRLDRGAQV